MVLFQKEKKLSSFWRRRVIVQRLFLLFYEIIKYYSEDGIIWGHLTMKQLVRQFSD